MEPKSEDFITEISLLDWLQLKKAQLTGLRLSRQFPHIKLLTTVRMYYIPDVLTWLLANRKQLNLGMVTLSKNQGEEAD